MTFFTNGKDRVLETSTTAGAGAITLAGAVAGFVTGASQYSNGDTDKWFIEAVDADGIPTGAWEVGTYTWGTGNTLTIVGSPDASSTGSKISWAADTKRAGVGVTAARMALKQDVLVSGTSIKTINSASLLASGDLVLPLRIPIACSDETTALTTGTAKVTFRMPCAMTVTAVRASVTTAPTGSVLTVDINDGGTTILSTKLTIDAGEKTSTTAVTPAVISDTALADDAEITIDIDAVGSTIAGAGLKVWLIGTPA